MKTVTGVVLGAATVLGLGWLVLKEKSALPAGPPPVPSLTNLPVVPIPASNPAVSRSVDPPPSATVGPPNVLFTFTAGTLRPAPAPTTTAIGDVPAGTMLVDAEVSYTLPNGNGGSGGAFPVVWVSPDLTHVALQYKALGLVDPSISMPDGLYIAHLK